VSSFASLETQFGEEGQGVMSALEMLMFDGRLPLQEKRGMIAINKTAKMLMTFNIDLFLDKAKIAIPYSSRTKPGSAYSFSNSQNTNCS
jgi:hypothetical protein